MIEVFTKITQLDLVPQIFVRCGDYPDIDFDILVAADPANPILLQSTQHFGLGRKAHIADLVQEERSAVSLLEFPLALLDRRSKRPLFMPEQFAFDQFGRNSRTIDLDERASCTATLIVQRMRHQLLTGTVRAEHQHPCVRKRHFIDQAFDMNHTFRGPDHGIALRRLYPLANRPLKLRIVTSSDSGFIPCIYLWSRRLFCGTILAFNL